MDNEAMPGALAAAGTGQLFQQHMVGAPRLARDG